MSKAGFKRSLSHVVVLSIAIVGVRADQTPATGGPSAQTFEFVRIEPGSFSMGCSPGDTLCDPDESPAHPVRITKPYEIGKYEVTQAQWLAVMGTNPSNFKGDDRMPVERVTWNQVKEFLGRLNARKDGYQYRLPTEAEWEFAARAGTTAANYGPIDDIAWYQGNSDKHTHPVGTKKPNAWGLYDVQGNVYEWTDDYYADYMSDAATDPTGPDSGGDRVPRGGSWMSTPRGIRTSNRNLNEPDNPDYNIGFRVARVPAS